jgi:hypothetical protein
MDGLPRPSRLPPDGPPSNGRHDPEQIRQAMKELRQEIHRDAKMTTKDASRLVDWKSHVQSHPVLSVGLAAAAGFLLAPTAKRVVQLTDKQLSALAKNDNVQVTSDQATAASVGAASSLLLTIGAFAGRALLGHAVQRIESALLNHQAQKRPTQNPYAPKQPSETPPDEPRNPHESPLY